MMKKTTFSPIVLIGAALALCVAGCSPQAGTSDGSPATAAPATHAVSGLPVIPVTITTSQATHTIRSELATTPQQQARGLMFRTEMGADEGMLFPYEDNPHVLGFWMRNTVLPLDIIFIAPDRRVLNIAANAVPYSEESLTSAGVAAAVLELKGGRAAQLGIEPGDKVEW